MPRARGPVTLRASGGLLHFTAAVLLGAFLLFLVEPMSGKRLLPLLGAAPAVWTTCLVFFQATLLAGYAYAHGARRLPLRGRLVLHSVLVLLPLASLPSWLARPHHPRTPARPRGCCRG